MLNSVKEMQDSLTSKALEDYFYDCLGKTEEEIKALFKKNGIDLSDACAKECVNFCEYITPIDDDEIDSISGGNGNLPEVLNRLVNKCIAGLEDSKSRVNDFVKLVIQDYIDRLKALQNKPYDRTSFRDEITRIRIGVGLLTSADYKLSTVSMYLQEIQRKAV